MYNHITRHDSEAALWLSKFNLIPDQLYLQGIPPHKIIDCYNQASLVIAGRGHAQLIPFGLNIPVFSLISHDKIGFFLEDINHPEWGAEISDPNLAEKIVQFASPANISRISKEISHARDRLWNITMENIAVLKKALRV